MMRGIDISNWNNGIDPKKLAVDFIICKASEGVGWQDWTFRKHADATLESGKLLGFYHFARENNPETEAEYFHQVVKDYIGKGIPVLDYETDNPNNGQWCERFCDRFHQLTGLSPMLYISAYRCPQYFGTFMPNESALWVAGYPYPATEWTKDKMPYNIEPWKKAAIWQFTSDLHIPNWSGRLDGNICYISREEWAKLSGAKAPAPAPAPSKKSDTEIALEIVQGKWGNGDDRRKRLENAGYDYNRIQQLINRSYGIAYEVIDGKWGNGWNRKNALEGAGYNYELIQSIVNELLED